MASRHLQHQSSPWFGRVSSPRCRSALRSGWPWSSFCRVVRCSLQCARSPIRGALTSLATPSPCGLRRTLCAPGKPIRQPCCSREFHAPGTNQALRRRVWTALPERH